MTQYFEPAGNGAPFLLPVPLPRATCRLLSDVIAARYRGRETSKGRPYWRIEIWNSYPRRRRRITFPMERRGISPRVLSRPREENVREKGTRGLIRGAGHVTGVIHAPPPPPATPIHHELFVLNLSARFVAALSEFSIPTRNFPRFLCRPLPLPRYYHIYEKRFRGESRGRLYLYVAYSNPPTDSTAIVSRRITATAVRLKNFKLLPSLLF